MEALLEKIVQWARETSHVEAVFLVGSYARGTARPDSDLDVCIISCDREQLTGCPGCFGRFGPIRQLRVEDWGACTSVRVFYQDGPEVEFGCLWPSWLDLPLDPGTRQVLADGYRVLLDKKGRFSRPELLRALEGQA